MSDAVSARIQTISQLSPLVRRVVLSVPPDYRWRAGQFLAVRLQEKDAYYSIASADRGDGLLELAVRDSAEATQFLGQTELSVTIPEGQAALPAETRGARCCFVGMGTGIAPLRAAIQECLGLGESGTLTLLHGARTEAERLFSAEFEELAQEQLLDYRPVLSRPSAGWSGLVGRVQRHLADLPGAVDHYGVCGSREMVDEVSQTLKDAGANSVFAQGY